VNYKIKKNLVCPICRGKVEHDYYYYTIDGIHFNLELVIKYHSCKHEFMLEIVKQEHMKE